MVSGICSSWGEAHSISFLYCLRSDPSEPAELPELEFPLAFPFRPFLVEDGNLLAAGMAWLGRYLQTRENYSSTGAIVIKKCVLIQVSYILQFKRRQTRPQSATVKIRIDAIKFFTM